MKYKMKPETNMFPPKWMAGSLLLLITFNLLAFAGGIAGDFLHTRDDTVFILKHPLLSITTHTPSSIAAFFTTFHYGNYAPLQFLSYLADVCLWGFNPVGFHVVNLLFHIINATLFLFLLVRHSIKPAYSLAAALLFSVHPVQVETVVWIAERKNILCLFFIILTLHAWTSWGKSINADNRDNKYYWLALFLFLLALLSKSAAVYCPIILTAYISSYCKPVKWQEALLRLLPFFMLSLLFSFIAWKSQSVFHGGGRLAERSGNWFFTMPPVFAKYIKLVLWPDKLLPAYSSGYRDQADVEVYTSLIILIVFFSLAAYLIRRNRVQLFWFSCLLAPILPVSHIIPFASLMNDRYLYMPMIGVSGVLALSLQQLPHLERSARITGIALFTAISVLFVVLSNRQTKIWNDDVTLWRYVISHSPPNAVFFWMLGEGERLSGFPEESLKSYGKSLELDPKNLRSKLGAAEAFLALKRPSEAIPLALDIIRSSPKFHLGFTLLGEAYLQLGEREKAESALSMALQLAPTEERILLAINNLRMTK